MAPKKSFLLRLDPALWEALQALASSELRSVNGQIEYLLKQALRERGRLLEAPAASTTAAPSTDEEPDHS